MYFIQFPVKDGNLPGRRDPAEEVPSERMRDDITGSSTYHDLRTLTEEISVFQIPSRD